MSRKRYIVTAQHFVKHTSFATALEEAARLERVTPDRKFFIYEEVQTRGEGSDDKRERKT